MRTIIYASYGNCRWLRYACIQSNWHAKYLDSIASELKLYSFIVHLNLQWEIHFSQFQRTEQIIQEHADEWQWKLFDQFLFGRFPFVWIYFQEHRYKRDRENIIILTPIYGKSFSSKYYYFARN